MTGVLSRQMSIVLITCIWSFVPCNAQKKIDWKLGMTGAEMKQTVTVNSNVIFKWSAWHNVWKFPDQAAFDACDFSKATELASVNQNPFTYKAPSAGIVYFGCQVGGGVHC